MMTKDEQVKLVDILTGCAELLNRELSLPAIQVFLRGVEDLEFFDVSMALSRHVKTARWFPTVSEVREAIEGPYLTNEERAQVELAKALKAAEDVGRWRSVVFDDFATMAVIQQFFGGWDRFCLELKDEKAERFVRANFAKTYCAYAKGGVKGHGVLHGITDKERMAKRLEITDIPVFIGNPEKCKAIMCYDRKPQLEAPKGEKRDICQLLNGIGG